MVATPEQESGADFIPVGRILAAYGVKGWVKVNSFTEPANRIGTYRPLYGRRERGEWRPVELLEARIHGKGVVARIAGCDDRDAAERLRGLELAITREQLPRPAPNDYYWIDLIGTRVLTLAGDDLGQVDNLMETGANDVLVVKGERDRLIPFILEQVIKEVDLEAGVIRVDWDTDF